MKNKLLFIMFVALMFSSCLKDDIVDTGTYPPPAAEVYYEANIIGKVIHQEGFAIEGALVSNNGEETSSDNNGLFR